MSERLTKLPGQTPVYLITGRFGRMSNHIGHADRPRERVDACETTYDADMCHQSLEPDLRVVLEPFIGLFHLPT